MTIDKSQVGLLHFRNWNVFCTIMLELEHHIGVVVFDDDSSPSRWKLGKKKGLDPLLHSFWLGPEE